MTDTHEVSMELEQCIAAHPASLVLVTPSNAITGNEYQGGNINRLLLAELQNGYGNKGWAGFHQWLTIGRVVRKGEHGTQCMTVVSVKNDKGTKTVPRGFRVFNFDQTEELGL